MLALIDCNNFYASCERIFNPKLNGKPLVILSNNDGCVIARSDEAKAIGIPMGAPAHHFANLFETFNVSVLSSNFALYGEISRRLVEILKEFTPEIEIYSIDESFIGLDSVIKDNYESYGKLIRKTIFDRLSLPVSIGIAPSKTLTKIGNKWAKKNNSCNGVKCLINQDEIDLLLKYIDVGDIWGIGRRIKLHLNKQGVYTAFDFKKMPNNQIRDHFGVLCSRTQLELFGIPCISLEEIRDKKRSIASSRTFRIGVKELKYIQEAVSSFTAKASEKLRKDNSVARIIEVTLMTDRHNLETPFYINTSGRKLESPTSYTPLLIQKALSAINDIFIPGLIYRKAMVFLNEISPVESLQYSVFGNYRKKEEDIMHAVDKINTKKGREIVKFGSQGFNQTWRSRQSNTSRGFLTRWDELVEVN